MNREVKGAGRKADPFRYWLPEREAVWKADPIYELVENLRQSQNLPFASLQQRKKAMSDAEAPFSTDGDE